MAESVGVGAAVSAVSVMSRTYPFASLLSSPRPRAGVHLLVAPRKGGSRVKPGMTVAYGSSHSDETAMTPTLLPAALPDALVLLDYVGIAVFAVSGALLAAEKKQTLVTFIFFAVATGVGGGTLRDLLIGAPVFWVHANATLLICIAAALSVWIFSRHAFAGKALLWFDAIGLAAYATYGAAKALTFGVAPVPAFAMGVMTACVGGIIRDVLAGEPSILMRPELYVTAAALLRGCTSG
jgi:uncharacterized membrane protein YeiH